VLQTTPDDWYSITMPATANALRLETSTPGDGPGQFANTLNPVVELYDSTGTILLASGVAMSDGRNESILANGLTPGGTYKVRVTGQSGTTGEYFLTRTFSGAVVTAEIPTIEAIDIATMSVASLDAGGWSSSVDSYTVQVANHRSFLDEWFAEGLDELSTPMQDGEIMEYFG